MNEREAWIFLNRMPHWSPLRFRHLREFTGSALAILKMELVDFCRAGIPETVALAWLKAIRDPAVQQAFEQELDSLQKCHYSVVTELDADYPARLQELSDRPPVLYYKGMWPLPERLILGLVGTRHPSPYGISVAQSLSRQLVAQGVVMVSGLALGIDCCVHETTVDQKGLTVAVLGNGLGQFYPKENRKLQQRIYEEGLILSEFPYNMEPEAWHFPRRNRIISGLSAGVVVIEAGDRSGALITARYAAEQGREVFAVPGSIFQPVSQGCHRLLKQGAKLVQNAEDILEEFEFKPESSTSGIPRDEEPEALSASEKNILDALAIDTLSVDELASMLSMSVPVLSNLLLQLQFKGKVCPLSGQRYGSIKKN